MLWSTTSGAAMSDIIQEAVNDVILFLIFFLAFPWLLVRIFEEKTR